MILLKGFLQNKHLQIFDLKEIGMKNKAKAKKYNN